MPTEELSGADLGDVVSDETTSRFVHHAAALHVGLPAIDRLIGHGPNHRTLTAVTGPAGSGRTSLAIRASLAHVWSGAPVELWAASTSAVELGWRMLAQFGNLDLCQLRSGALTARDWSVVERFVRELSSFPLTVRIGAGLADHLGPPPDPHVATSIVVIDASARRQMCANDLSAVIARAESTAAQRVIVVGDPAARERADVVLELPCSLDDRGLHEVMPVTIRLVRNRFGPVGARRVVFRERTAGFEDAAEDDGPSSHPAGCVRRVAWA